MLRLNILMTISANSANHKTLKVTFIEISVDRAGQRIDNFLITHLKGVPKSRIYRLLRKGEVRVNKGRIKADYRLNSGDMVRIPPVRQTKPEEKPLPDNRILTAVERSVLYEDEGLLVLNKPSGIAVHGGSGITYGVIEALRTVRSKTHYLELVHRLDRETSGCLLIAKKRSMLRRLHELFRSGAIDKRYLALLSGRWQGGTRKVDAALKKNVLRAGERVVRVDPDGKHSVSVFRPQRLFSDVSLVEIELKTGRTHQIRVHAASIGMPVAGDEKYGDSTFNRRMRAQGLRRLFLHAKSVGFTLPDSGQKISVSAAMDSALSKFLENYPKFIS